MEDSIIIVGFGDIIRTFLDKGLRIFHGYAKTRIFNHGNIVEAVSAADHGIRRQTDAVEKLLERVGLINVLRHNLKEKGF